MTYLNYWQKFLNQKIMKTITEQDDFICNCGNNSDFDYWDTWDGETSLTIEEHYKCCQCNEILILLKRK